MQAGANEAASETPGSGSESESEFDPDPTLGGTAGGTGEEASLGVSGSRGGSGVGRRIELTGRNLSKTT